MGRQAIKSVNNTEQKNAAKSKQEIKALPSVFTNEEHFRMYITLATLLYSEDKANAYNDKLTANKLLTVKQSVDNYAANGIELEKEFYPAALCVPGLFCGIHRMQRVIFAVGFIGDMKLAFTISTRALKILPELANNEKIAEKYGYAPKYLTRLDANNGTLLPGAIDFNHFCDMNFGLPFCYTTSKADLLDFAQWTNDKGAFERYKAAAAEFETVKYIDNENCIADFCKVAIENGFMVYRQDVMKVAIDHMIYLQGVIKDSDKRTATQQVKARARLYGDTNKADNDGAQKAVETA